MEFRQSMLDVVKNGLLATGRVRSYNLLFPSLQRDSRGWP